MCLNSDYAAALFEGKVQLHMVSHLYGSVLCTFFHWPVSNKWKDFTLYCFWIAWNKSVCFLDWRQRPGGEEADEVVSRWWQKRSDPVPRSHRWLPLLWHWCKAQHVTSVRTVNYYVKDYEGLILNYEAYSISFFFPSSPNINLTFIENTNLLLCPAVPPYLNPLSLHLTMSCYYLSVPFLFISASFSFF